MNPDRSKKHAGLAIFHHNLRPLEVQQACAAIREDGCPIEDWVWLVSLRVVMVGERMEIPATVLAESMSSTRLLATNGRCSANDMNVVAAVDPNSRVIPGPICL